jgi:beta-lactamase class A
MNSRNETEHSINKFKKRIRLYQVLLLIFFVVIVSMLFILKNKRMILENNPYPLINPMREFVSQKDFIVNIQPLRDYINNLVANEKDLKASVYFEVLNTGANISVNPQLQIFPASLAKLPLAMAVAKKVEDGKWQWGNELVFLENDVDKNSGFLYEKPIGSRFTIENLMKELLVNSDNTAYRILVRNMDSSELFKVVEEVGLEELMTRDGRVSAKEYSRMFRALYSSSFLKRVNSEKILEWLTQTSFREYLNSGLPEQVKFSHKIGENDKLGIFSDVGIVYAENRPYLIAVMVQSDDIKNAKGKAVEFMNLISKKSYEYIQNQ